VGWQRAQHPKHQAVLLLEGVHHQITLLAHTEREYAAAAVELSLDQNKFEEPPAPRRHSSRLFQVISLIFVVYVAPKDLSRAHSHRTQERKAAGFRCLELRALRLMSDLKRRICGTLFN